MACAAKGGGVADHRGDEGLYRRWTDSPHALNRSTDWGYVGCELVGKPPHSGRNAVREGHRFLCRRIITESNRRIIDAGEDIYCALYREGGSIEEREKGKLELYDFVYVTYSALVSMEKKRLRSKLSGLQHLARVDVSVMRGDDGKLHYFVNEVERGVAVCFFMHRQYLRALEIMDELGEVLLRWLDDETSSQ
jgi:hypothetical protein